MMSPKTKKKYWLATINYVLLYLLTVVGDSYFPEELDMLFLGVAGCLFLIFFLSSPLYILLRFIITEPVIKKIKKAFRATRKYSGYIILPAFLLLSTELYKSGLNLQISILASALLLLLTQVRIYY